MKAPIVVNLDGPAFGKLLTLEDRTMSLRLVQTTLPYLDAIPMHVIEREHKGYWFTKESKRFFRSRVPSHGYRGPGGTFFVSSEQYVGSDNVAARRRYTIRELTKAGDIRTVGPFNKMARERANRIMRILAQARAAGFEALGETDPDTVS